MPVAARRDGDYTGVGWGGGGPETAKGDGVILFPLGIPHEIYGYFNGKPKAVSALRGRVRHRNTVRREIYGTPPPGT